MIFISPINICSSCAQNTIFEKCCSNFEIVEKTSDCSTFEQTELQKYVSSRDSAFDWIVDHTYQPFTINELGKGLKNLIEYKWITLTSQFYLNSTFVDPELGGTWTHNVLLCHGKPNENSNFDEIGYIKLQQIQDESRPKTQLRSMPKSSSKHVIQSACQAAAEQGTVGIRIEGIPAEVKYVGENKPQTEGVQAIGANYYFSKGAHISAIAEFAEVKAVVMAMEMADEYLISEGYRSTKITKWGVMGDSKRGAVTFTTAAADPRMAFGAPRINTVEMARSEVFRNDLNALGGANGGWSRHINNNWYEDWLRPSEKRNLADTSLSLKNHVDKLENIPMYMPLGAQDTMMHIDNINAWWDSIFRISNNLTLHLIPNQGHTAAGFTPVFNIFPQAIAENKVEQLPRLNWKYATTFRKQDTVNVCLQCV